MNRPEPALRPRLKTPLIEDPVKVAAINVAGQMLDVGETGKSSNRLQKGFKLRPLVPIQPGTFDKELETVERHSPGGGGVETATKHPPIGISHDKKRFTTLSPVPTLIPEKLPRDDDPDQTGASIMAVSISGRLSILRTA